MELSKMPLFTIYNKATKHSWSASAEEAYFYASNRYVIAHQYIVYDREAKTLNGMQLLTIIYKQRQVKNV